jgi:hypothetical protein
VELVFKGLNGLKGLMVYVPNRSFKLSATDVSAHESISAPSVLIAVPSLVMDA